MLYLERKKYNSFALKNIKILIPTPPSFSADAYFWCFNLQQLVLKICKNYFKIAATLFNLKQLYFICSNFILLAATFFNLQQLNSYLQQLFNLLHVPCGLYRKNTNVQFDLLSAKLPSGARSKAKGSLSSAMKLW